MTLQTISIKDTFTTDAEFRTWGSGISGKLSTLGFVQTSDTGQINWTTVTKPAGSSTAAGYEIWRFADSLQSTAPIFFKLSYGTSGGLTSPQITLTVGTNSDGAGTITNNASFANTVTLSTNVMTSTIQGSSTVGNIYCWAETSGGGALGVLLWPTIGELNYQGSFFGIERFRNLDGTASGDGFNVTWSCAYSQNVTGFCQSKAAYMSSTITQPATVSANNVPTIVAGTGGTGSNIIGTTLYPLPVFTGYAPPRLYGPSQMLIAFPKADIAAGGNTFTMSHYGVSRTWISAGQAYGASTGGWGQWSMSANVGWSFAMRGD
jgi:hypothetical protein